MTRIRYREAAGLKVQRGKPPFGKKPSRLSLRKLYVKELKSIREISDTLGCSKDMIYRALKEYRIQSRRGYRRSKLRNVDRTLLKKEIMSKGITKVAKELSVDVRTLKKYV